MEIQVNSSSQIAIRRDMRKRNPEAGLVVFWVKLRERGYTHTVTSLWRVLKRLNALLVKLPNPKCIPKPYEQMCYPGQRVQVDVKEVPAACAADDASRVDLLNDV